MKLYYERIGEQEDIFVKTVWNEDTDGEPSLVLCEDPYIDEWIDIKAWDSYDVRYVDYDEHGETSYVIYRHPGEKDEQSPNYDEEAEVHYYPVKNGGIVIGYTEDDKPIIHWLESHCRQAVYRLE